MSLPKPKSNRQSSSGSLPDPITGGDFDPFLTPSEIGSGKLGATAKLTFIGQCEVDMKNQFGARVQCTVRMGKTRYVYGVKLDGGSYGRLFRRFGNNPKKWKGVVNVEVKRHMKKLYVAVV